MELKQWSQNSEFLNQPGAKTRNNLTKVIAKLAIKTKRQMSQSVTLSIY